jgi:hypothetical protein
LMIYGGMPIAYNPHSQYYFILMDMVLGGLLHITEVKFFTYN